MTMRLVVIVIPANENCQEENTVVPSSVAKKVIGMAGKLKIKDSTKKQGGLIV